MKSNKGFFTRSVHSGEGPCQLTGAHTLPIYQTSTFIFDNAQQGAARFAGEEEGYVYTRLGNPTQRVLEIKMADLEGAEDGLAFSSGMGAISALLLHLLSAGDHILTDNTLYGCTHNFVEDFLPQFEVQYSMVDASNIKEVEASIQDNTRLILFETPANPTMKLIDIRALSRLAAEAGVLLAVDNTFMSPFFQKPLKLGADVVLHSATKFIGGHGDVIAGLVLGSSQLMDEMRNHVLKDLGAVISPFNAWLLIRGLKTLGPRMVYHEKNARFLAENLDNHPLIEGVNYPGLKTHPQHQLACEQMEGFGSMISFEMKGGYRAAELLVNSVELASLAVSLGTVDTLIQHPASMTHARVPEEEKLEAGIRPGLVRISVGIEDREDIWNDLKRALELTAARL